MGGAIEDVKSVIQKRLFTVMWSIVIIIFLSFAGYGVWKVYDIQHQNQQLREKLGLIVKDLPEGVSVRVVQTKKGVTILQKGKAPVEINKIRGNDRTIDINNKGEVKTSKIGGLMPKPVLLPHLVGKIGPLNAEPALGCQILRSEDLKVGANVYGNLNTVGVSITRDVLDNSLLGLSWGVSKLNQGELGLYFGVYF